MQRKKAHPLLVAAVCDGQIYVGAIRERNDGSFEAFDAAGKRVGTFATLIKASRAIPSAKATS
jgi:hypothetical protein